ncbi:nicotinate-nucleotide pyrophosphorylase [carboxylating] [Anseongella ginsenosidimutans]|uniref:Probable nicotinate-nucleotide pyrophosphorylase [carboxylating] n=1 Tax=Anseongella ginsenosidimutans TaxID=496056 RepID=A0A4R3KSQ4_9SPHI|nr:carboxylating nicotinate-nucleotide diphosphorylase [Anseongella ginsenosidimutans]QEC53283.1 carboxylating nicotinate-nucleotide diphosphorylase [Anseongella ginsenosidimutans]TCS88154.1 nicotinate-nucleotide pyrophosphorylase [carboxylating] [Anseongella ginsenosidimutans]
MQINEKDIHQFIQRALAEDLGDGDHTSLATIPEDRRGKARLLAKEKGVIAGVELALHIFREVHPGLEVRVNLEDGSEVYPGDVVLTVEGDARAILTAERLVLNCMQRMSGIATLTREITRELEGTGTKVLDTRKTTPCIRFVEKWAVTIGGGVNHRFGLYDMILIKDNHVDYAGGIRQAIEASRKYLERQNKSLEVEIEVRNAAELEEVLDTGNVDRILLDNFSPEALKDALARIDGRFVTEASGGITSGNIREYAGTGVDFISMGALTHSVKSLDLSLKAVIAD